jgi:hypothetical protein
MVLRTFPRNQSAFVTMFPWQVLLPLPTCLPAGRLSVWVHLTRAQRRMYSQRPDDLDEPAWPSGALVRLSESLQCDSQLTSRTPILSSHSVDWKAVERSGLVAGRRADAERFRRCSESLLSCRRDGDCV